MHKKKVLKSTCSTSPTSKCDMLAYISFHWINPYCKKGELIYNHDVPFSQYLLKSKEKGKMYIHTHMQSHSHSHTHTLKSTQITHAYIIFSFLIVYLPQTHILTIAFIISVLFYHYNPLYFTIISFSLSHSKTF